MPATIKVMTWNVENLFRPPTGAAAADTDRFRRKLTLLANTIAGLDPDVVALQELGGDEPLGDLQEALGVRYPHRRFSAFPDRRGIGVGFLSRLPIDDSEDIVQLPAGPALDVSDLDETGNPVRIDRMGRGALRIRVAKEGFTTDLVTAHLKSKLLSFARPGGTSFAPHDEGERAQVAGIALRRRAAEAVTLRLLANQLLGNGGRVPLLVLGDLNDVPDAATTQILLGPPGSELGTAGFHRADAGDGMRLFNLAPAIAEARRFSRIHKGRGELLDQILASAAFFPRESDARRRLPVEVDSHVEFAGGLPSVGETPAIRADELAPDHAPVTATFEI
jgi:endonuclease/exonuclease/phosphatase family metal-dependent hydrolase